MKSPSTISWIGWAAVSLCAILLFMVSPGCDRRGQTAHNPDRFLVAVSLLPQAYFVERIGGEHVDVEVLVGPGQSHATFDPTPKQLTALAQARLFFRIGLSFEDRLLEKLHDTHANLHVIDTRAGVKMRQMEDHAHEHEGHAHDELLSAHFDEAPGGADPHIWLAPLLVKTQGRTICDALKETDPSHASDYERNLAVFLGDLDTLNTKITTLLAPYRGRAFFIFHPGLGYFADAYGLRQVAVEDSGREPSAKQIAELIRQARGDNIRVIFVQQQFARKSAEAIAEAIDGRALAIDPLSRAYMTNLYTIAALSTV